jgi:branched-chain amino acid transport system permease protein
MQLIIQALISGTLIGGLYGIIAVGVTLNWGMLKIINLAHFSLFFFAAYISYQFSTSTGADPLFSLIFTIPLFFVIGVGLQWFFEVFAIEEFVSLLVTFGIFVILESVMREIWTADLRTLPVEIVPYRVESVWIGPFALRIPQLLAFLTGIVVAAATWYFLNRTYAGKALRALSQDKAIAGAFGVNHRRLSLLLGGIAGVYAAIAGVFVALMFVLRPDGATEFIGVIFAVVILGGLGNTAGAFAAGIIVGIAQSVTSAIPALGPGFSPLVTFSLLIIVLLFKPEGLFTRSAT